MPNLRPRTATDAAGVTQLSIFLSPFWVRPKRVSCHAAASFSVRACSYDSSELAMQRRAAGDQEGASGLRGRVLRWRSAGIVPADAGVAAFVLEQQLAGGPAGGYFDGRAGAR